MICPLLKRFLMERHECPIAVPCDGVKICFWARFHQLDPLTGKPLGHGQPNPTPPPERQLELL